MDADLPEGKSVFGRSSLPGAQQQQPAAVAGGGEAEPGGARENPSTPAPPGSAGGGGGVSPVLKDAVVAIYGNQRLPNSAGSYARSRAPSPGIPYAQGQAVRPTVVRPRDGPPPLPILYFPYFIFWVALSPWRTHFPFPLSLRYSLSIYFLG